MTAVPRIDLDAIPFPRDWKARRDNAQAQATKRRDASATYRAARADIERREQWRVPLINATARRQKAEKAVTELEVRVVNAERMALDDHSAIALIRPARDNLEVAREILMRAAASEEAERVRYEAKVAQADAEATTDAEVVE